jgi:ribonuclease BN (tRNA processing enzyme)
MELVILGSGTGVPSLTRGSPATLVRVHNRTLLIDSGSGTLERLLKVGTTLHNVDMILCTHIHPDHTADLVPFLFASKYEAHPRRGDLILMGGQGFRVFFQKLQDLYGEWIHSDLFSIELRESGDERHNFEGFSLRTRPMAHRPESIAFRVETDKGRSVVLSGDTDYNTNLVDLASLTDVLVLECAFPDEKKVHGHLSPSLAGRIASESRCKRLILTHLYPICDRFDMKSQCASTFDGPVEIAYDLMHQVV